MEGFLAAWAAIASIICLVLVVMVGKQGGDAVTPPEGCKGHGGFFMQENKRFNGYEVDKDGNPTSRERYETEQTPLINGSVVYCKDGTVAVIGDPDEGNWR